LCESFVRFALFVSACRFNSKVCTVIGFPFGATSTASKEAESEQALRDGARELDIVIHIGRLHSKDYDYVEKDVAAVVQRAHHADAIVKVIIETSLLSQEEKIAACVIAKEAGSDFVKTSTGYTKGGACTKDVALMRLTVGDTMGVKASGGIKTRQDALRMIAAGANRIGTGAGVSIVLNTHYGQEGY
jgi:deoxyribose-phosphate aldolase